MFDPASINTWLQLVIAIAAVSVIVTTVVKKTVQGLEHKIVTTVQEATSQIKTDANGGQSLNDVAKALREFKNDQAEVNSRREQQIATLLDKQQAIKEDIEDLKNG